MVYFVATPIGNLKDMTYRAVETLNAVDVIACEDTRHSKVLLEAYDIRKPLVSCHKFNEKTVARKLADMAKEGKEIAVISDAGMPSVSDPGWELVKILIEEDIKYTVLPGACAFATAMVFSGYDTANFAFIGFLPEKTAEKKKLLERYSALKCPLIFYTAPHDVDDTVKDLYKILGERKAVVVRELTKVYEQRVEINLKDGYTGEKRGEFVIIVEGNTALEDYENVSVTEQVKLYEKTMSKMDAIKLVARERGLKKNDVYRQVIEQDER
ncbi:MAG: 16S rRNA (cytidine(1402)-2'-O)-methyltransferase [Christensenellaceae bacterium]